MRRFRKLTVCFIGFAALVSSGLRQQENREATIPGAATAGIDIAVAIVAWKDKDRGIAQKMLQVLKPVVDAIASGAKLTKADAARTSLPADDLHKLQDWLTTAVSKSKQASKPMIFIIQEQAGSGYPNTQEQAGSGYPNTEKQEVKCPVCGSTQHEFCFRLLDFTGPGLETIPVDDPELSCITLTNGTCYPVDCCGGSPGSATGGTGGRLTNPKRTVVVFIVGGTAQDYKQERQAFVKVVTEAVEKALSSTSRLVIKTKSSSRPGRQFP